MDGVIQQRFNCALCLLLAFAWRVDAQASTDDPHGIFAGAACAEAANEVLSEWRSTNEFLTTAGSTDAVSVLRSPTTETGVWVVVRMAEGRIQRLARVSADIEIEAAIDERCRIRTSVRKKHVTTDGLLTDNEVEAILADRHAGVFYAWSPHMPLSVDGLHEIFTAGERLDILVTPVLSSHANIGYARDRTAGLNLPDTVFRSSHSIELEMRDFNVHAPAILVFQGGRFVSPVIPGFRYAEDYEALIGRFLQSGEQ